MSNDGRLTVRFNELLPDIQRAAKAVDRDPSDWVRLQIRRVLLKRAAKAKRRPGADATATAAYAAVG